MAEPFILGVNYWPRRKAMFWWSQFDADEVREEFALIRELGLHKVRIFLLWDDFQDSPDTVNATSLENLVTVADIALANGLGLDVTFFTGHMSGPNWSPRWMLDSAAQSPLPLVSGGVYIEGGYRNPITDPVALDAQVLLLQTVVTRLKDHAGVWMWNLGNEPDLFATAPRPQSQAWLKRMTDTIRAIDPVRPITCGLHVASLLDDKPFRVDDVAAVADKVVMHGYPMYVPFARDPLDPDFVPFCATLNTALANGKPTLFEEFGGCTAQPGEASYVMQWTMYGKPRDQFMASEEDFAAYITQVLERLQAGGASGAMLWCFADYAPELWNRPPCDEVQHERFFGLVRPDGSLKPHAQAVKAFAARGLTVKSPNVTLTVDADTFYENPPQHFAVLYAEYLQKLAETSA